MKKETYLSLTFLILSLILVNISLGISEDFTISTLNKDISLCPSSNDIADIISIKNTGSIESGYTIGFEGKASSWITLSETFFTLKPGEEKDIYVYITSNSLAQGESTAEFKISTNLGLTKSFSKTVSISNCNNLNIIPKIWSNWITPCKEALYEFEIYNAGSFTETYYIKTSSKFTELSHSPAVIDGKNSQTVYIYAKPSCDIFGNNDFLITVSAKNSKKEASFKASLMIEEAYNFSISAYDNYTVCLDTDETLEFYINNKADLENAYKLDLKKEPDWLKLDKKYPIINAKESGKLYLNVSSPKKESETNITLTAESLYGNEYAEKTFTLKAIKCKDIELSIPGTKDTLCKEKRKDYSIEIKNNGLSDEDIILSLNGPSWATLSENEIFVEKESSKSVILTLSPDKNSSKENIEISAVLKSNPNIKNTKKLSVSLTEGKECTAFTFNIPSSIKINSSIKELAIPIQNLGTIEEQYTINMDAPDFISLKEDFIELNPGDTKDLILSINSENITGSYDILLQATSELGESYSQTLKIQIGDNTILEFTKIILLYIIIAIGIILIISGILILKEKKDKTDSKTKKEKKPKEVKKSNEIKK